MLYKIDFQGFTAEDDSVSVHWFRHRAEQGRAGIENYLQEMYECGRHANEDKTTAVHWYHKSNRSRACVITRYVGI